MNKYRQFYNENIETFPPKKCWAGTPNEYIEALDNHKDLIIKTVEEFTTKHKAKDIRIRAGQNGYNMVAIISFEGEITEEEKLQRDKEAHEAAVRLAIREKEKLKELIEKYPETAIEGTNQLFPIKDE